MALEGLFKDEPPFEPRDFFEEVRIPNQISGVCVNRLLTDTDSRGCLTVLFSEQLGDTIHPPHVYLVETAPKSIRGWVYHKHQHDRLAYTNGTLRIVLYDIREDSPTHGQLNVLEAGTHNKVLLIIPPKVVHGVQNYGNEWAYFVNMPTQVYHRDRPDKSRLPIDHPSIPYRFG